METSDITTSVLIEIRGEVRGIHQRMDRLESRMDGFDVRMDRFEAGLDSVHDNLSHRITESELRTATAINSLAGTLHDVHTLLRDRFGRRKLPDD